MRSDWFLQEDVYPRARCRAIRILTWIMRSFAGVITASACFNKLLFSASLLYAILTPLLGPVFDTVPVLAALLCYDTVSALAVAGGLAMAGTLDYLISSEEGCHSLYQPVARLAKMIASRSQILRAITSSEPDKGE